MMWRTRKNDHPLARRMLWISSPLVISLPLILGVQSLFSANFINVAALLPDVPHFQFEQQAQQHCPGDSVVWTTARSGIYNSNTERWYGRTGDGTFTCLLDAQQAGYHATRVIR
jgi:hypothetical protein